MSPKKDEKREALFNAALSLFARHGYKKTTVEDVADALGMTKGNLYFYVKNKQDLYYRTIHWALNRWQDDVRKAVDRERAADGKFKAMARSALAYIENETTLQEMLVRDPEILTLDRRFDRFPDANGAARQIIREIIDLGIQDGTFAVSDPDASVNYLFSIYMMFLIQTYVYLDKDDFRQMFDAALELNLKGLKKEASPSL